MIYIGSMGGVSAIIVEAFGFTVFVSDARRGRNVG